ncbi:hypothetical protein O6H91_06G020200 [Diphasiastrum complanatum]|uniref:Uncharacterized protein n=1 Tax=Diphasiastrum complanatum TaxID=34168 RepID=A0ACC2DC58_DIPCM|nr:hypothetical protein O6H91_06G020200 [Diphasiastrum complanatum]
MANAAEDCAKKQENYLLEGDGGEAVVAAAAAAADGASKGDHGVEGRGRDSSHRHSQDDSSTLNDVRARAIKLAAEPVTTSKRDDAWGVLTAVSENARQRSQGLHLLLHNMEHVLGRNVKDLSCQFDSPSVSARHCKILRRIVEADGAIKITQNNVLGPGERFLVFIKDSSSNGTYLNHQRLRKDSPEACLQHGDIISLVAAPEHENAYAFVYREVFGSKIPTLQPCLKRKGFVADESIDEGSLGDGKRMRGLGIGAPDGPVSLDDVRRLQRANEELRQQLEDHLLTIEKMRNEFRAAETRHETELKELRSSVTTLFAKQIEDIRTELSQKNRELESYTATTVQQQSMIEDLNQHIVAAAKSRMEAEEAIQNHKGSIAELEKRLTEERTQARMEREASEADYRASLERARIEAAEEMKRHVEAAARQQKQHLEVISALQEADKENRSIADSLRVKLEEERKARMDAEKRIRKLEIQLSEERASLATLKERIAQLEQELQKAFRQLEGEKARESATAKIVTLELEMETAINNLKLEKQRLEGARERIVLRETQLRAFHSTAEEIAALQQRQQEQLKAMLRTLEDGDSENHLHTSCGRGGESRRTNGSGKKGLPIDMDDSVSRRSLQRADAQNRNEMVSGEASEKVNKITTTTSLNRISQNHHNVPNEMKMKEEDTEQDEFVTAAPSLPYLEVATAAHIVSNNFSKHLDSTVEDEKRSEDPNAAEAAATQLLEVEYGEFANEVQTITAENRTQVDESNNDPECFKDEENDVVDDRAELEEGGVLYGETMQLEGGEDEDHTDWERTQVALEDYGATLPIDNCPQEEGNAGPVTSDFHYKGDVDMIRKSSSHENFSEAQRDATSANEKSLFATTSRRLKGIFQRPETDSVDRRDMHSLCTMDLVASEVAGSWAASTPMSQHDDNDSCHSDERIPDRFQHNGQGTTDGVAMEFAASQVATSDSQRARPQLFESPGRSWAAEAVANTLGSQNTPSPRLSNKKSQHHALSEMISIVAPDFEGLDELVKSVPHASDSEDYSDKDDDGNDKDEGDDSDSTHSEPTSRTPSISTP